MGAFDSIVNAPRQQKVIFGAMLLIIVGALSYFLLISPAATDRDGLQQQNEVLRAEVLKARADEANLRPFRAQAEALRKRLETAKERLPSEREIPRLYRQVSDLASQAGLGVALFQPKNPEDRDVLTEVPIAVTVECNYNQLGAFFEKLGQLPRIVSLGEFKFTGIERPTGTVRAEMTLATYVFRPEGAPPPPKPGAPAPAPTPPPPAGQPGAPPGASR
jgi:type IV pilus assembly protein PilO